RRPEPPRRRRGAGGPRPLRRQPRPYPRDPPAPDRRPARAGVPRPGEPGELRLVYRAPAGGRAVPGVEGEEGPCPADALPGAGAWPAGHGRDGRGSRPVAPGAEGLMLRETPPRGRGGTTVNNSTVELVRTAEVVRKTGETDITLSLGVDGSGMSDVATGIGFLDHMPTL